MSTGRSGKALVEVDASEVRVWKAAQAAAYVGESRSNFYRLVKAGAIPHFRQGRRSLRFDRQALDAWLDEKSARCAADRSTRVAVKRTNARNERSASSCE